MRFFATSAEWRNWLQTHHETDSEVWVGLHRRASGRPSITWPQSVDEALCFGWIDGVRKRIDADSYRIRFTPRQASSHWSAVNVSRVRELTERGLMHAAGLRALQRRRPERTATASYERERPPVLDREYERQLRANAAAAAFFDAQPPWYRRAATHWILSAKREQTRRRRLDSLIAACEAGEAVAPLRRRG